MAARRTGQIIARGERKWLVRVYIGEQGGKRRYLNKTIHGTKKDAQAWLNETLRSLDLGRPVEPAKLTLGEYLDDWLSVAAKPRVRERTYQDYEWSLGHYVRPVLGSKRLASVTALDLQSLYLEMTSRGLSAATVRKVHTALSSAFRQAVTWRLIHQSPCQGVELPRLERKEMNVLTAEQTAQFLEAARTVEHGIVFAFAIATGMRPGEYLALRWADVDLEHGRVSVVRTVRRKHGGGWSFDEPKTAQSRRQVPIGPATVAALRAHRADQAVSRLAAGPAWEDYGLVFAGERGQPLDEHNLHQRQFRRAVVAAGIAAPLERGKIDPSYRLYDLRHTCATLMLLAGESPKVVAERLGHSSVTMTLDVYSHVLPSMQEAAAARLDAILYGSHTIRTPETKTPRP